ncbi:CRP-like cAMP-binding protein [Kibdelosporangium banguiense]|uniref:CRP-like cAMP-binding protein n=1 Tax=Kibdelosporangium banguiense TaxID=1365924 RepID=A0ABS4TE55_9PSEU|nr:Crp/Fnr family transcriptional regulator [Kibdelosporangium banguiense]MBP2322148.1 CRP-like cAMP-binding protein [Kibdelosporangium banguiense]
MTTTAGVELRGWLSSTLLGRLPDSAGADVLRAGEERDFSAEDVLMRQGDQDDHVLLLLDGLVKVIADSEPGQKVLLGIRVGGDVVGEMAALERAARMATVTACRPGRALFIRRPLLDELMITYPVLAVQLAATISGRLRKADERCVDITSYGSLTRLSRALISILASHGARKGLRWRLDIELNQAEIGSLVGLKKRTAEKCFKELRDNGVIECEWRVVEVIDMPRLRRIADDRQ